MKDRKVLLHHVDGHDVEVMLGEFLRDNEFDPELEQEIISTLAAGKPFYGGGGASPEWGLEPIKNTAMEDREINELRRRAGLIN